MPTYDYRCEACGHTFERFQPITAPAIRKCPICKKLKVHRLVGAGAGVIFRGSGFYQTDYRSKSYREAAKKDNGAGAAAADGGKPSDTSAPKETSSSSAGEGKDRDA